MSAASVLVTWVAVNNDPFEREGDTGIRASLMANKSMDQRQRCSAMRRGVPREGAGPGEQASPRGITHDTTWKEKSDRRSPGRTGCSVERHL